jgi:hypothetical protein
MIYVDVDYICTKYLDRHRQTNQPSERESKPANRHQKGPAGTLLVAANLKRSTKKKQAAMFSNLSSSLIPPFSIYLSLSFLFCRLVDIDLSISPSLSLVLLEQIAPFLFDRRLVSC